MEYRVAWSPLAAVEAAGYKVAWRGAAYHVAAPREPGGAPLIALAPMDWPMLHAFTARGRLYASPHPHLEGWRGGVVAARDPETLEPTGLARAERRGRRYTLEPLEGRVGPWSLLDPYTPAGLDPPARPAVEAALRGRPALLILVRSHYPGSAAGLQRLPPAHAVAYAPCPEGARWPGLAEALSLYPAALRVCVEAPRAPG